MNPVILTLITAASSCIALTFLGVWLSEKNRKGKTADTRNWITTLLNVAIFVLITACFFAIDSLPDIVGNIYLYAGHAHDVYHYCLLVGAGLLAIIIGSRIHTHFVAAGWILGGWILFVNNFWNLYTFDSFYHKTSDSILTGSSALPIIVLRTLPPLLLIAFAYWYDQHGEKPSKQTTNELPWLRDSALVITLIFGIARSLNTLFSRLKSMAEEFQFQTELATIQDTKERALKIIGDAQEKLESIAGTVQCNPWLSISHFLIGLALIALGFRARKKSVRAGFIVAGWMTSGHAIKNCFGPHYHLIFGISSLACLVYLYHKRYRK